jgi:hypothetical protein
MFRCSRLSVNESVVSGRTRPLKSLLRKSESVARLPLCRAQLHTNAHTDRQVAPSHPGRMVGNSGRRKTRPGGVSSSATCRSTDWQAICVCVDLFTGLSEGTTSLCPDGDHRRILRMHHEASACGSRAASDAAGSQASPRTVEGSASLLPRGMFRWRPPCFSAVMLTIHQACGGHVFACVCMTLRKSPFQSRSSLNGPHFRWYCAWIVVPVPKPSSSGVAGDSAYHTRRVHTFSRQVRDRTQLQLV